MIARMAIAGKGSFQAISAAAHFFG
jgi:hypothetical protein